jgi:hypothetical protein
MRSIEQNSENGIEEEIEDEVHELFPGSPRKDQNVSSLDRNNEFSIPPEI